MKILIVDDSMAARMMLKKCIPAIENHQVFEAGDGKEGLDLYMKQRPDVTFMDLTMPVMSGFESLEKIRAFDQNAYVVVLTADIQKKSIDKSTELGAKAILKKLPTDEQVQEIINKRIAELRG